MPKYYLVVSSVTTAQRLQKLCQRQGISVSLVHTPQDLSQHGCSYSLIVSHRDYETAVLLADENKITIRDCFLQKDGSYQKV